MRDKSLAVAPEFQRKGYGKEMIDFLCRHYADKFCLMTVGTGDSMSTISFIGNADFIIPILCRISLPSTMIIL